MRALAKFAGPCLLVLLGLVLAVMFWRRLGDIQIDFPREVYGAWRMAEGGMLGRDVFTIYGPASLLINGAVWQWGGGSLTALLIFNHGVAAGITFLVFKVGSLLGGRLAGWLCAMFFLGAVCFSHLNYFAIFNFITPYSHDLVLGLAGALIALLAFERALASRHLAWVLAAGFASGFVLTTKPEPIVALGATALLSFLLTARHGRTWRERLRWLVVFGAGLAVVPLVVCLILAQASTWSDAIAQTFGALVSVMRAGSLDSPFARSVMGIDRPWLNLGWSVVGLVGVIVLWLLLGIFARGVERLTGPVKIVSLVGAASAIGYAARIAPWQEAGRVLPLALLAVLLAHGARYVGSLRRGVAPAHTDQAFLLAGTFALALLAKLALHPKLYHYGFALALPAMVVAIAAAVHFIQRTNTDAQRRYVMHAGVTLFMLVGVATLVRDSFAQAQRKTFLLGVGGDRLWCYPESMDPRAMTLERFAKAISEHARPDDTVCVLPEGAWLNLMLRQINPTGLVSFSSKVELRIFGESMLLERLQSTEPAHVAILSRNAGEHGLPRFGTTPEYGGRVAGWLRENYVLLLGVSGDPVARDGYGAVLLQHRNIGPKQ